MDRNPQAEQMAHESMLRNLASQARAIWPQERELFARYAIPRNAVVLDIGCGTGEITSRLAEIYPHAQIIGVDLVEELLDIAHIHCAKFGERVHFQQGDAFELPFADGEVDLVVCRHLTQAVPASHKLIAELLRVCKPGGYLHVLSEDYSMIHFPHDVLEIDRLFKDGVIAFAEATGTDARIGRLTWSQLIRAGATRVHVDYVVVDTLRVPREEFAEIMTAWRDGYTQTLETHGRLRRNEARSLFDAAIAAIRDEHRYVVWHIPIVSAQKAAKKSQM